MLSRAITVVAATCWLFSALPARSIGAEAPRAVAEPEPTEPAIDVLLSLPPGQRVRVVASGGASVEGRLADVRDGHLVLEGALDPIPIGTVRTVWARDRGTGKGMVIGGAIGGVASPDWRPVYSLEPRPDHGAVDLSFTPAGSPSSQTLPGALVGGVLAWHLR
jgi:hypothetical protein